MTRPGSPERERIDFDTRGDLDLDDGLIASASGTCPSEQRVRPGRPRDIDGIGLTPVHAHPQPAVTGEQSILEIDVPPGVEVYSFTFG